MSLTTPPPRIRKCDSVRFVSIEMRFRYQIIFVSIHCHARFYKNECILSIWASKTTAPIIDQCIRSTIYIPVIAESEGNWGGANEQVME